MRPEDVVNLDLYPIADPSDPARATLIAELKRQLDDEQHVTLPDFIRPAARKKAVADTYTSLPNAYHNCSNRNCYLQKVSDPSLPETHPRNIMQEASTRMLAYDLFPDDCPVKTLYHWEPVRQMVAAVVGEEELFDNEDPCQPVNLLCYQPGDQSAWHFDSGNAFTMTLMLQAPDGGGAFEMVPDTRTDDDHNYDYVRRVVAGQCPEDAVSIAREAASLCIFRGCNSIHRVAPVTGDTMRIMSVFVYEREPGVVGDPQVNATIYGR